MSISEICNKHNLEDKMNTINCSKIHFDGGYRATPRIKSINAKFTAALLAVEKLNRQSNENMAVEGARPTVSREGKLKKVLIANRGEIAKRFFLALHEESIRSVAVVTSPDEGQSWYEFADEVVFIGDAANYSDASTIIAAAVFSGANAIYSGYGFLSENSDFVEMISIVSEITGKEILFMGPDFKTMRRVGDKVTARKLVAMHDIPLFKSSVAFSSPDSEAAHAEAEKIGYPVIVKLSSGGGGKGMYPVFVPGELDKAIESAYRIGIDLYRDGTFYLEKFLVRPVHIEVQVFNGDAIGIRKCAVQRRNQKIIEESGHTFLDHCTSMSLLAAAEKISKISGYSNGCGAGTVEFLIDSETGKFGFMEMNTRLQVEYAVTDQSLGIDLAKWQILHFDGRGNEIENAELIKYRILERKHAIECRIYAEEPEKKYIPSTGRITTLDLPTFNGIRCDFGFAEGDSILPTYDPMIGKLIAHGATRDEALIRMERALQELYIRGVRTNISQLLRIVRHPAFINGDYANTLLDEYSELGCNEKTPAEMARITTGANEHIVLGGFTCYIRLLHESINNFAVITANEGLTESSPAITAPSEYSVVYNGKSHSAEYLQISMNTFNSYIDGEFSGVITLESSNERGDDYLVIFRNSTRRIRVDRTNALIIIRMRDSSNKIEYYRIKVTPEGDNNCISKGAVKSPFQGTFVSFCGPVPRPGDRVKEGDSLVILSSMKMETTLTSPVSGVIRFVTGSSANGESTSELAGRSIKEGELLFDIEPDDSSNRSESSSGKKTMATAGPGGTLGLLLSDKYEEIINGDTDKHFDLMLSLFQSIVYGYTQHPRLTERLVSIIEKIPREKWQEIINDNRAGIINDIIIHYTSIRRLFSPIVYDDGFSFSDELDRFVLRWDREDTEYHPRFREQIDGILASYGIASLNAASYIDRLRSLHFFLLLKQSGEFYQTYWKRVGSQVHIVASLAPHLDRTLLAIRRLFKHTQSESDDSSHKLIRRVISTFYPEEAPGIFSSAGENTGSALPSSRMADKISGARNVNLPPAETGIIPGGITEDFSAFLNKRIERLQREHQVSRLSSNIEGVVLYMIQDAAGERSSFIAMTSYDDTGSDTCITERLSTCIKELELSGCTESGSENRVEIFVSGCRFSWEMPAGPGLITADNLRQQCEQFTKEFYSGTLKQAIINIDVIYPGTDIILNNDFSVTMNNDSIMLDILSKRDINNPYSVPAMNDSATQKLFNTNKWPIEEWTGHSLDPGSIKEIIIESIDRNSKNTPAGSRIFLGSMNGDTVLFYMKDFRVNGGATGDLEGRKYCAAAYIAGLKRIPLYVWNDSAGANINQGVVSLNRGAEGFMMNSLIAGNTGHNEFLKYVNAAPDPLLRSLFSEINSMDEIARLAVSNGRTALIAVGIGASAGLDVYGSSQATFQVLLNSENSYRVLTGSNVIKSVMGENISNYDIGGAQVLGKWAGVIDIVARDKPELISRVKAIQSLLSASSALGNIKRIKPAHKDEDKKTGSIIINESDITSNVDQGNFLPLKEEYYGGNALIGGAARIAGCGVVIMAPRTNSGLRVYASIIKAREILRIAYRTGMHQILIFGKRMQNSARISKLNNTRPVIDLHRALAERRGIRIHIITDLQGLRESSLNSTADVIIFVGPESLSEKERIFAGKNSTFIVNSLKDAFDISGRVISMISTPSSGGSYKAGGIPAVPDNASEPFDIIQSVIEPVCDSGTFIEFGREMNNPVSGPTLVTGLGRIEGKTAGIIADQPLTRGGGADSAGTEKFRVFTEFLNRHNIPIVMLSNSSGFVPGSKEERFRIQAVGAESLDANILGRVPVVSVILNQNYGGRLIQAFNGYLRPGIVYLARRNAMMSVLGANAAFDLLRKKEYQKLIDGNKTAEAENLKKSFVDKYTADSLACNDAMGTGVIDWLIDDISELREHLSRGIVLAGERCKKAFGITDTE
jgi:acetyl/propionyl-CoA carboxylase alpha subunit/acetyl-CoA carboxylase carboxyltransferase component